ncbi:hypothetical protein NC651_032000 [Populus alba x Populus x berolinensis]|nr:hypothetical protein NC651_032000 [Populus alba x Populus x berolinensis]
MVIQLSDSEQAYHEARPMTKRSSDRPVRSGYWRTIKRARPRLWRGNERHFANSNTECLACESVTKDSKRALSHRIISHTTMCFSNLVGPLEDIGFHGYPIAYLLQVLLINIKMAIVLSVDEGTIPDPHQLCDDIVESLKLIKDAVPSTGLIKDNI